MKIVELKRRIVFHDQQLKFYQMTLTKLTQNCREIRIMGTVLYPLTSRM